MLILEYISEEMTIASTRPPLEIRRTLLSKLMSPHNHRTDRPRYIDAPSSGRAVIPTVENQGLSVLPVNFHFLLYRDGHPNKRQFSGITRQDSISKCVAQFLEVIIRLSRQSSRWRQHCDLLRNARVILAQCSSNDVMTFMIWRQNSLSYVIT